MTNPFWGEEYIKGGKMSNQEEEEYTGQHAGGKPYWTVKEPTYRKPMNVILRNTTKVRLLMNHPLIEDILCVLKYSAVIKILFFM